MVIFWFVTKVVLRCNCVYKAINFSWIYSFLPIQGADVVLGIQWLELLGPVITNYKLLIMEFQWKGKVVQLVRELQINDDLLVSKQLMKLSKS